MSEQKTVSGKEAIKRLGVSKPTLYSMINRGKIRPIENPVDKSLSRRRKLEFTEEEIQRVLRGDPVAA